MLVLSRKPGERILFPGYELTVTVIEITGKSVRLGFTAPDHVTIFREEVWRKLRDMEHSTPCTELTDTQPR